MDDTQVLLTKLNDTMAVILQKLDEHDAKLNQLDSVLYDGIIGPANDQIAQQEYDQALSDFRCKFAEQLGPYADITQAVDGVDVYQKAFDTYNEGGFDVSPDEYVTALAESLKEQVAEIKQTLGVSDGVEVEATVETPTGEEATIETDGENVEVDSPDPEVKEEKDEAKAEESEPVKEEKDISDEPVKEDEPAEEKPEEEDEGESLEDFEKSLQEAADKDKDVRWIRQ